MRRRDAQNNNINITTTPHQLNIITAGKMTKTTQHLLLF
jgi:hypothetical protein